MNKTELEHASTSQYQITQLMNTDILFLRLTSVHHCIIDDTDELHNEFLMTYYEC